MSEAKRRQRLDATAALDGAGGPGDFEVVKEESEEYVSSEEEESDHGEKKVAFEEDEA